ncbi:MAG: Fe-S cluster assembly protein SufD [Planctomycetota bacterium]|nr:Fe-S cluster assembly protein SufD [Planctomycetota bacterium]
MSVATVQATAFEADFERFERGAGASAPDWLHAFRRDAMEKFRAQGIPGPKHEDWLYTRTAPLARNLLPFAPRAAQIPGSLAAHRFALGLEAGPRLVFLNGRFEPSLSNGEGLPEGVTLVHGAAMRGEEEHAHLRAELGQVVDIARHPFAALNSAFLYDGFVLHVPPGVVVEQPVQTLFLHTPVGEAVSVHPRLLLVAGANSQVTFIEHYGIDCIGALAGAPCFTNAVTEYVLEAGANVRTIRIQREGTNTFHVGMTAAKQARDSRLDHISLSLGGAIDRNEIHVSLDEPGAECNLHGLYVLGHEEHVDNHTVIRHQVPHCKSTQLFKGVLGGKSNGAFTGRVVVAQDAQKTIAEQANHNLLLSDHAVTETRPQLEIYADDVQCAHGATIGRLDEEALYYLRSRGVGPRSARNLLVHAFASEITEAAGDQQLIDGLEMLIASRLEGRANVPEEA